MPGRGCRIRGGRGQRNENSDGPIVRGEILLRNALDILRRNRTDAFHELIDAPPASPDGFRLSHQHGMAEIRILLEDPRSLDLVLSPLKLKLRRRLILE